MIAVIFNAKKSPSLMSNNTYFGRRILMSKKSMYGRSFVKYIRRTFKNKVVALAMIGLGVASRMLSDDATFLVFMLIFAIPLFFARKNYVIV